MKILFCDDELPIGDIAKEIFLLSSNEFLYTNTVAQSELALSIGSFDVVIIDLNWEESCNAGFDIIKKIKKMNGRPKVFITCSHVEKYAKQIEENRIYIDGVFKKPEDLLDLLKTLAK